MPYNTIPARLQDGELYPREYDNMNGEIDWKRSSASNNKSFVGYDTTPNGHAMKLTRSYDSIAPEVDWKSGFAPSASSLGPVGLEPNDVHPSQVDHVDFANIPADFDWKSVGAVADNQPNRDLQPLNAHPDRHKFRDDSVEGTWKISSPSRMGKISSDAVDLEPLANHPNTHKFRDSPPLDFKSNWKPAGIESLQAPVTVVESAVDVVTAAKFPFRKLDRFKRSNDWNSSSKPAAPQEYKRGVFVKKRKGGPRSATQSPSEQRSRGPGRGPGRGSSSGTRSGRSSTPPAKSPQKMGSEKAALVSYLDLLLSSNTDVEDEIAVVFELLADSGCSKDEIAGIVEMCSGAEVGGSGESSPVPSASKDGVVSPAAGDDSKTAGNRNLKELNM